jgi:cytochrome d ubiquinol oxidase subunit II
MSISADLNNIWYVLVGVLLTGYIVLDGFDFGVGTLHLFVKKDEHRRILINAIGPVWDGNEVWLVTAGGALFAAFPLVYAEVFSGFYIAFMLLLFMLIFRAVAIEFRSKQRTRLWRSLWDTSFAVGSVGASLIMGVALGNIAAGVPLNAQHQFREGFLYLLRPYPILVGVTAVALFAMHGCIYLVMKTEGELQQKIRGWVNRTIILFIFGYVATTAATLLYLPHMTTAFKSHPWLLVVPVLNALAIANIPREIHHGRDFRAFLSSCAAMAAMMLLFGIGLHPNLVYSAPNPENSLTLYNAASSPKTLTIMLIIAGMGIPIVLAYTSSIYWIFRGKVKLDETSY